VNFDIFGGRRFLLVVVSGFGTFLLCWVGRIDGNAYFLTMAATVAAYITGNVAQRKVEAAAPPG